MKINTIYFIWLLIATVLVSCVKQDRENTIIEQEKAIDNYISNQANIRVVRNGGSNRIVTTEGEGADTLAVGDSVYYYYSAYIFSSGKGTLFATNDTTVAVLYDFHATGEPEKAKLGESKMISGIKNGLRGVKEGENCDIVFSAKYGFNNTVVYNVPKLSPLFYEIKVTKIVKNR